MMQSTWSSEYSGGQGFKYICPRQTVWGYQVWSYCMDSVASMLDLLLNQACIDRLCSARAYYDVLTCTTIPT